MTDSRPVPPPGLAAQLPVVEPPRAPVPVFDCHVLLSGPDEQGKIVAQSTRLPHLSGTGSTERDALLSIVAAFKQELRRFVANGEPIPWAETPLVRQPGQQERWIPVHL